MTEEQLVWIGISLLGIILGMGSCLYYINKKLDTLLLIKKKADKGVVNDK